ncbi:MAG: dipeptidase [Deinococcota bacterium]
MPNTQDIPIFDGHNDTLLLIHKSRQHQAAPESTKDAISEDKPAAPYNFFERNDSHHIDLPRAKEGNFAGGFFAVYVPAEKPAPFKLPSTDSFEVPLPEPLKLGYSQQQALAMMAILFELERTSNGDVKVVRTVSDINTCLDTGSLAVILHMEGAEAIDGNLDALEVFYQAGLRSLGIVWSRKTIFAEGVPFKFPGSPDTGDGLTAAGKELVKACNRLGIMIDLSHMNEKGFWDVAKLSDAPLVATHSNVHALCPTTRNLTDDQLAAVKDSSGMVGLNYAVNFLRQDGKNNTDTPLSVMADHIEYLVDKLGIDHVGLGSDFDGATVPQDIGDVTGTPKLLSVLAERGYDDTALRKLAYQNWLGLLSKTW